MELKKARHVRYYTAGLFSAHQLIELLPSYVIGELEGTVLLYEAVRADKASPIPKNYKKPELALEASIELYRQHFPWSTLHLCPLTRDIAQEHLTLEQLEALRIWQQDQLKLIESLLCQRLQEGKDNPNDEPGG